MWINCLQPAQNYFGQGLRPSANFFTSHLQEVTAYSILLVWRQSVRYRFGSLGSHLDWARGRVHKSVKTFLLLCETPRSKQ